MKKTIAMLVIAFAAFTSANAQSTLDLIEQQKKINQALVKYNDKAKIDKDAKKEGKKLEKAGWMVPMGRKSIAAQISEINSLRSTPMADENGNPVPRYIIQEGHNTNGTLNTGVANARATAQNEIAASLETKVAGAMKLLMGSKQSSSINATTVEKFEELSKSIIDACLTNTQMVGCIYRELPNHNYEVQVTVAYDKEETMRRLKQQMQDQLEIDVEEDLDDLTNNVISNWD